MPGRVYLDKDGDAVLETWVMIPERNIPIHAESVNEGIRQLTRAWREYFPKLAAAIGLEWK